MSPSNPNHHVACTVQRKLTILHCIDQGGTCDSRDAVQQLNHLQRKDDERSDPSSVSNAAVKSKKPKGNRDGLQTTSSSDTKPKQAVAVPNQAAAVPLLVSSQQVTVSLPTKEEEEKEEHIFVWSPPQPVPSTSRSLAKAVTSDSRISALSGTTNSILVPNAPPSSLMLDATSTSVAPTKKKVKGIASSHATFDISSGTFVYALPIGPTKPVLPLVKAAKRDHRDVDEEVDVQVEKPRKKKRKKGKVLDNDQERKFAEPSFNEQDLEQLEQFLAHGQRSHVSAISNCNEASESLASAMSSSFDVPLQLSSIQSRIKASNKPSPPITSRSDRLSVATGAYQPLRVLPEIVRDAQVASSTIIDTSSHEGLELTSDELDLDRSANDSITSSLALSGAGGLTEERQEVVAVGEAEETRATTVRPPEFQSKQQVSETQGVDRDVGVGVITGHKPLDLYKYLFPDRVSSDQVEIDWEAIGLTSHHSPTCLDDFLSPLAYQAIVSIDSFVEFAGHWSVQVRLLSEEALECLDTLSVEEVQKLGSNGVILIIGDQKFLICRQVFTQMLQVFDEVESQQHANSPIVLKLQGIDVDVFATFLSYTKFCARAKPREYQWRLRMQQIMEIMHCSMLLRSTLCLKGIVQQLMAPKRPVNSLVAICMLLLGRRHRLRQVEIMAKDLLVAMSKSNRLRPFDPRTLKRHEHLVTREELENELRTVSLGIGKDNLTPRERQKRDWEEQVLRSNLRHVFAAIKEREARRQASLSYPLLHMWGQTYALKAVSSYIVMDLHNAAGVSPQSTLTTANVLVNQALSSSSRSKDCSGRSIFMLLGCSLFIRQRYCRNLAVLAFGLNPTQAVVLSSSLELVLDKIV
ncbi:hypothetical protein C8J56DRAFT_1062392 [Mycena floridula]|nr:hypothetical protein C8J56DRAFT_1062392 [Mycena floridula]